MRHFDRERGTSLIEMMFVLAILGILITTLARFFGDSRRDLIRSENDSDLAAMTRSTSATLGSTVRQSERILVDFNALTQSVAANDPLKTFRDAMNAGIALGVSGCPAMVSWTVAPKLYSASTLVAETAGSSYLGNSIYMIVALQPVTLKGVTNVATTPTPGAGTPTAVPTATPNPTRTPTRVVDTPQSDITLDRYQFVCVYLSLDTSQVIGSSGLPGTLKLVEWRSKPYVSYSQLNAAGGGTSTLLFYLAQRLQAMGYTKALDISSNDAATAFHTIDSTQNPIVAVAGGAESPMPGQAWGYVNEIRNMLEVNPDPLKPKGRVAAYNFSGGLFGKSYYSVAYNNNALSPATMRVNALKGTQIINLPVPLFAAPNATNPYPAGFETAVTGTAPGAREIWMRVVYMGISSAQNITGKEFLAAETQVNATVPNPD